MAGDALVRRSRRHHRYTTISNDLIRCKMSPGARMLVIYLLSFPEDWEVRCSHIEKENGIGPKLRRKWFKEAREHGYMDIKTEHRNGRLRTFWEVYDEPICENAWKLQDSPMGHPVQDDPKGNPVQDSPQGHPYERLNKNEILRKKEKLNKGSIKNGTPPKENEKDQANGVVTHIQNALESLQTEHSSETGPAEVPAEKVSQNGVNRILGHLGEEKELTPLDREAAECAAEFWFRVPGRYKAPLDEWVELFRAKLERHPGKGAYVLEKIRGGGYDPTKADTPRKLFFFWKAIGLDDNGQPQKPTPPPLKITKPGSLKEQYERELAALGGPAKPGQWRATA